jgi:hypothetical protein
VRMESDGNLWAASHYGTFGKARRLGVW